MKTTAFCLLFTLAVTVLFSFSAFAVIRHVPGQYSTIQAAIDAAQDGDTVLVAPGTYYENIQIINKTITLASLFLITNDVSYINATTISGDQGNSSVIKVVTGTDYTTICGFKISDGKGTLEGDLVAGCGIYFSGNGLITDNEILYNGYGGFNPGCYCYGAGVYASGGELTIKNNNIHNNDLWGLDGIAKGGGIYAVQVYIFKNFIHDNEAVSQAGWTGGEAYGGGIFATSSIIKNNMIINNVAGHNSLSGAFAYGGGCYAPSCPSENNIYANNHVEAYAEDDLSQPSGAHAEAEYGGCLCLSSVNDLVYGNYCSASAMSIYSEEEIARFGGICATNTTMNTTITGNSLNASTTAQFAGTGTGAGKNNIVYNNVPDNGGDNFTYSWFNDPLFTTGPQGAYYLSQYAAGQFQQSPCVDAGDPSSPMIEGITRTDGVPDEGIVDIGFHYGMDFWDMDVDFNSDTTQICIPQVINFQNTTEGIVTSRLWSFPGGSPESSTLQNPSVQYSVPGVYDVQLIASNPYKTDTLLKKNYIHYLVTPTVVPVLSGPQQLCINSPDTVYTVNEIPWAIEYTWELLPDTAGTITGTSTQAMVNWNDIFAGEATIQVKGTNFCGTGPYSDPLNVSIIDIPGIAQIPSGPAILCSNSINTAFSINNIPFATEYNWEITPINAGTIDGVDTMAILNLEDTFIGNIGIYVAGLNYCGNGLFSDTLNVLINPALQVEFELWVDSICNTSPAFSLSGGIPEGGIYSGNGVQNGMFDPQVAGEGVHTITYTYTGNYCIVSAQAEITVENCYGITENSSNPSFHIFPNPNNGKFNIQLNKASDEDLDINVYDPLGKLVYEKQSFLLPGQTQAELTITPLHAGMYFIKLQGEKSLTGGRMLVR